MLRLRDMSLSTKFTVGILIVFLVGIAASWVIMSNIVRRSAEQTVAEKGQMLLAAMNAVRAYTTGHINPLVVERLYEELMFIPESVPAYSARTVFENLRGNPEYGDFFYREVTNNPTNPRDRADDFEGAILTSFRQDPEAGEISGFRTLESETVFYSARPLRLTSESCLQCHSSPQVAPASLINTYGPQNGFGWELGDVIAAQMIYVPATEVINSATARLNVVMAGVIAVFVVVVLVVNTLLRREVVRPVVAVAALAEKIGHGEVTEADLSEANVKRLEQRGDEIGRMTDVFLQMARNVIQREASLHEQLRELRFEVDEAKKQKQVAEITGTEYFQTLKAKADQLRANRKANESPGD